MNIPNALTLSRLAGIPILMVLLIVRFPMHDQIAAAMFILFSFTDTLDGQIARRRGTVSDFGKFVDPLADKLFVLAVLLVLVQEELVPAWVVVIIFSRELIITLLRWVGASQGRTRALLDADPLAVPGLAVRAVHQGRMPGYSAVVVVEQVLDSGTTLAVITARPATAALEEGVTGAARTAAATPSEHAGIARERAADSVASLARQPSARAIPRSDTRGAGLWFDVRGPLAADSLAALGRRLEPLRP